MRLTLSGPFLHVVLSIVSFIWVPIYIDHVCLSGVYVSLVFAFRCFTMLEVMLWQQSVLPWCCTGFSFERAVYLTNPSRILMIPGMMHVHSADYHHGTMM